MSISTDSGLPSAHEIDEGAAIVALKDLPDFPAEDAGAAAEEGWCIAQADGSSSNANGDRPFQLQALYEAGVFPGDAEAIAFVLERADEASPLHKRALSFLEDHSPAEYRDIMGGLYKAWITGAEVSGPAWHGPGTQRDGGRVKSPSNVVATLVLSTGHLAQEVAEGLVNGTVAVPMSVMSNEYGFLVNTVWRDIPCLDIPTSLKACLDLALDRGCTYIVFDRDAEIIDGLPSYDW